MEDTRENGNGERYQDIMEAFKDASDAILAGDDAHDAVTDVGTDKTPQNASQSLTGVSDGVNDVDDGDNAVENEDIDGIGDDVDENDEGVQENQEGSPAVDDSDGGNGSSDVAKNVRRRDGRRRKPRKRRSKLARRVDLIITTIVLVAALGMMAYPWVMKQMTAAGIFNVVTRAKDSMNALSSEQRAEYYDQARAYNAQLARTQGDTPDADVPDVESVWRYEDQLTYQHDPMMSWVEIPSINVSLPIYHGTTQETLMNGVGHMEGTSLPVGGASTRCVLTAHSGMPGATMFDDIRQLHDGDLVLLHTMGDVLAYKVYASEVVWPDEMDRLKIEDGRDLVTLLTCTPYGVNDHRLLVHCERTDYDPDEAEDARSITNRRFDVRDLSFMLAVVIVIITVITCLVRWLRKRGNARKETRRLARRHAGTMSVRMTTDGERKRRRNWRDG